MKPVPPQGLRKPIRWLITCSIVLFLLLVVTTSLSGKAYAAAATGKVATVSDSCGVHYVVNSQFTGSFVASITIKNTGTVTLTSWTLAFSYTNGQKITILWNGSYTQSGGAVTITNLSYDGTLVPGATVTPGFYASWSGTNSNPTSFTLNNVACSLD